METVRKPFQGIWNIIRFNWHFYAIALGVVVSLLILVNYSNPVFNSFLFAAGALILVTTTLSLLVSFYVYDLSNFYDFEWIEPDDGEIIVVNINAGFDETSILLKQKFKNARFSTFDFYNPEKHTEISIKRARRAYPPYANTQQIEASNIDLKSNSVDKIFVVLSAHEIRDKMERILFFKELNRIIKPKGQIIIVEHLRDVANFVAYNNICLLKIF